MTRLRWALAPVAVASLVTAEAVRRGIAYAILVYGLAPVFARRRGPNSEQDVMG